MENEIHSNAEDGEDDKIAEEVGLRLDPVHALIMHVDNDVGQIGIVFADGLFIMFLYGFLNIGVRMVC